MIRLNVKNYCENCQYFEAEVSKVFTCIGCVFEVKCADAEKCRAIAHCIRDHMEKENWDD